MSTNALIMALVADMFFYSLAKYWNFDDRMAIVVGITFATIFGFGTYIFEPEIDKWVKNERERKLENDKDENDDNNHPLDGKPIIFAKKDIVDYE